MVKTESVPDGICHQDRGSRINVYFHVGGVGISRISGRFGNHPGVVTGTMKVKHMGGYDPKKAVFSLLSAGKLYSMRKRKFQMKDPIRLMMLRAKLSFREKN